MFRPKSNENINEVKFYYGHLANNENSNIYLDTAQKCGYKISTKPVKIMKRSIDVSGIDDGSPAVISNFIAKPLLHKLDVETVEFLNKKLRELNRAGISVIEMWKCNFDVEIGRDMLIDYERHGIGNFILWSGDSDFADPVRQLLADGQKVMIFSVARRIAVELGQIGVGIFDIRKIKEFICRTKELPEKIKQLFIENGL